MKLGCSADCIEGMSLVSNTPGAKNGADLLLDQARQPTSVD